MPRSAEYEHVSDHAVGNVHDGRFRRGGHGTCGSNLLVHPGALGATTGGINNSGQILGDFVNPVSGTTIGFLYTGGNLTIIDVPGALDSQALKINDSGQIVGTFQDAGETNGFLATPVATPEPASLITLATSLVALSGVAWHRKRASAGKLPPA